MASQNIPTPAGSNEEHEASSPEKVHERPNNQSVSYHRRITDGSYVGVHLSPGFRFAPREEELIKDYLNMKINNQAAKYIQIISDVDVYKHTPEELTENNRSFGEDEGYFFCPRDRKYLKGNRSNRATGNGYWKATGKYKKLHDNGVCIGSRTCLVFYEGKHPKGTKTNWLMREYVTQQPGRQPLVLNDMRLDDCVLYRIYKKPDHPKQKNIHLPMEQNIQGQPPNLQAGQDTLNMAGDEDVGGQELGYHLESSPEVTRQIPDLNIALDSSMGYLEPTFNDNDHPQGHCLVSTN